MAPVAAIAGGLASIASVAVPVIQAVSSFSKPKAPSGGGSSTADLEASLYARQANEESDAARTAARDAARKRQLALAASGVGRNDTILTSPFGEVGGSSSQPKTLLGA